MFRVVSLRYITVLTDKVQAVIEASSGTHKLVCRADVIHLSLSLFYFRIFQCFKIFTLVDLIDLRSKPQCWLLPLQKSIFMYLRLSHLVGQVFKSLRLCSRILLYVVVQQEAGGLLASLAAVREQ